MVPPFNILNLRRLLALHGLKLPELVPISQP